jgi:hypothetical protein
MVKNYTSQVPANRSIQHIEDCLVKHGAKDILKLYVDKRLTGVAFIVTVDNKDIPFRLPARIDRVEKQLRESIKRPRSGTLSKIKDQAERTSWKILADWVDIQMSLIELDQVELMEVFLPYVYDYGKKQTFFDKMKSNNFSTLLEDHSNNED